MAQQLKLYSWNNSRGLRVSLLLEELGIDYELILLPAPDLKNGKFPSVVRRISPTHEVPVLEVSQQKLTESNYIMQYLLDLNKSELIPDTSKQEILHALYTCEGAFSTCITMLAVHAAAVNISPPGISFLLKQLFAYMDSQYAIPKLKMLFDTLEARLAKNGGWYVGNKYSAADIAWWYDVHLAFFKFEFAKWSDYPHIAEWYKTICARPACERVFAKHSGEPTLTV